MTVLRWRLLFLTCTLIFGVRPLPAQQGRPVVQHVGHVIPLVLGLRAILAHKWAALGVIADDYLL